MLWRSGPVYRHILAIHGTFRMTRGGSCGINGAAMAHAEFVHLHVHSAYSLSEGALKLDELIALCRDDRMPAVAVTDTGNLFGALEFSLAAARAGVQPIIGCQLWLTRPQGAGDGRGAARLAGGHRAPCDQLVLLVQNEAGYRNLVKLSSMAFLEAAAGEPPQVSLDDVAAHADGLIALTGGPAGSVGRLLAEGQIQAAKAVLERLAEIFPDRLYVELMRHGLPVEQAIEGDLIDLADGSGLPLVATNDCYFADAGMYEAHDALLCIADGALVAAADRRRLTPEHRFRSAAEMRALFSDVPEAVDNALLIARRCAYRPEPRPPILPRFDAGDGRSEAQVLEDEAEAGLQLRLESSLWRPEMDEAARAAAAAPYRERLAFELQVIIKMGFPGYFLIVADFVRWAKAQQIPVGPGRGSGAGSMVAWALMITDLDPLRHGLLFERFLNPERVSMPDFDIDFCQDRRDEVIDYVRAKYGADRVAQIITFGTLQARAALRDVGRVLGMPYGQVDRLCKLVPYNPAHPPKLKEAIESEPELRRLRDEDETVARLLNIALRLEGLYRHASTHAAGVVIADRPLIELIPVYRDPRSTMVATQFAMKHTELAGLVKFDFLGLKTLTVLERAVELIRRRGIEVDLASIPLDDPAPYALMGRAETVGVFQLESPGMREVLRQLKPDSFADVVALVALYRPGPMDMIPRYIACKHGRERPDYLDPKLEGILKETSGVIVYQEQVMQIAQVLSGFNLAEADLLRRAMGKKIKAEMEAQRQAFVDGAVARGVDRARATHIFELVDKFAGYGFNKSHAAAYALIAYQTAWLKANHPVEFMAALMTLDLGNTDKLAGFKQELDRMGVALLPPDVNASETAFTVEERSDGGAVRYALAAIKNVGASAMDALVAERRRGGRFRDLADFASRLDAKAVNRRQLENLVKAGALDRLNSNRRQVFDSIDQLLRLTATAANERDSRQQNLFGDAVDAPQATLALSGAADWPAIERLTGEFDAIGFYLSAHPLDAHGRMLERLGVRPYGSLTAPAGTPGGSTRVRLAGLVTRKQERTSGKGNRFAHVQLTDASGVFEITVFAETLAAARALLEPGSMVLVDAELRREVDGIRLTAQAVESLDAAARTVVSGLTVTLSNPKPLSDLREALAAGGNGRGRVTLILGTAAGDEVRLAIPGGWAITPELCTRIGALPGVEQVVDV